MTSSARRVTFASLSLLLCLFAVLRSPQAFATTPVPEMVLEAEAARVAAIRKAIAPTLAIFGPAGSGGGSGVVITPDGYALTNYHVSKPAGDYLQCGMADGKLYDAVLVGIDPTGDVALIKLLGRDDFPTAELGDSDQVRMGDWCFAVGNPFLLASDFQPTVTYGIVSGVHRYQYPAGTLLEYADCIQTDAAINPGNSGGPLFNADGVLIGINGRGSFEKRGRVNVGVGYAISINQIKNFLGHLRSGRIVDHATLGATVSTDETGAVVVTNILDSSDAWRRGLRYGDHILAFGGREINTVNAFKNVLGIFPQGWRVPLSFERRGERFDVFVRLAGVHSRDELLTKIQPQTPLPMPDDQPEKEPAPHDKKPQPEEDDPHAGPSDVEIPEDIAKLIISRPGYANYYFNQLERSQLWDRFISHGEFQNAAGPWILQGQAGNGTTVKILLDTEQAAGQFPAGPATLETQRELETQLEPAGSGGLLLALFLYRKLLTEGPADFGDVYYLGKSPLPGEEGLFDVLVGTYQAIECRFLFHPKTGSLIAMEMFPDVDVDPCEVRFGEYRQVGGRQLPYHLDVRHGDMTFLDLRLESFELPGKET